jgi:hypothetical protein
MAVTVVETVLFSAHSGNLAYRVRTKRLRGGVHPDALARRLARLARLDCAGTVGLLHSTSWRFDGGAVVLTYAALPDPTPTGAVPLDVDRAAPYPIDPLAPGAVRLTANDVAVHAGRHLSYLRRTDPLVARAADAHAELWDAIGRFEPALAGALGGVPITVLT